MRTAKTTLALGTVAALLAACGPTMNTMGDGATDAAADAPHDSGPPRECTPTQSPCDCFEQGPPDYSRMGTGQASASSTDPQREALNRANYWRTSTGITALNANAQVEQAAQAHSHFMATTPQTMCWPGVHQEVESGCAGFTGINSWDRMTTAGYAWMQASEVINWDSTTQAAVDAWMWTVYHRQPFLNWKLVDMGYGTEHGPLGSGQANHNDINFATPRAGRTGDQPAGPVVFPVPGQTDVPTAFNGWLEGPTPPAPGGAARWPSGRPSGTVISMHFPTAPTSAMVPNGWTVTEHHIFLSNPGAMSCEEVPHTFISYETDANLRRSGPASDVFMYADQPLTAGTQYVARIVGTSGGAAFTRTWGFTTR